MMRSLLFSILNNTLFKIIPTDYFAKKYPVSVKGIIVINEKIILLKNERNEWELPGGKIEPNESIQQCLIREIKEELNIDISVESIVDTWLYNVLKKVNVLIITYKCVAKQTEVKLSNEHKELGKFAITEIEHLNMPRGYKNSIFKTLQK